MRWASQVIFGRWHHALRLAAAVTAIIALYTTDAAAAVPTGGRTWEMVSPTAPMSARMFVVRPMSDDSDRFVYSTISPFPGSEAGPIFTFVATERGQAGWINTPVSLPYSIDSSQGVFFQLLPIFPAAFSKDLHSVAWLSTVPLTPEGPPENQFGLYRKSKEKTPEFIAKVGQGALVFGYPGFVDIASDGSRVIFTTKEHLLASDAGRTSGSSIYEWDGSTLHLVDVDSGGSLLSECGADLSHANGMSASAKLVFFTIPGECGGIEKESVYVRNLEAGTTTRISSSNCTRVDCDGPQDATFATATRDGSLAFITTKQQLTNEDHDEGTDLYRYDVNAHGLTLISGGSSEASGEVIPGQIYPSDDGTRVYFLGSGQVLPGESTSGTKLFLADSGGVHLVAELQYATKPEVQVSANGTRVVFTTEGRLLPSDTDSKLDVYLYDANQENLTHLSIGPTGGNGSSTAFISSLVERPEFQTTGDSQPFYAIDGSGERIIFSTTEALVPEDINEKLDVYEWWNGQLGLISSGQDEFDSGFVGVSRDGRSALFVTNASLSPADVDGGNRDFYIARLEGGFPEEEAEEGCDVKLCPAAPREPVVRPAPKTLSPSAQSSGRIRVIGIRSKKAGVVGASTVVLAEVPAPGLVSASVWVRQGGRKIVLATGTAGAVRAGKVRIDLRLTRAGRKSLHGMPQRGRLTVEEGSSMVSQSVKMDLG
jgi:hypothetical protein